MLTFRARLCAALGGLLVIILLIAALSHPAKSTTSGPVPVTVTNTPLPITNADVAARTPVMVTDKLIWTDGNLISSNVIYTVPAGTRLTITSIYANGLLPAPENIVQLLVGGVPVVLTPHGSGAFFVTDPNSGQLQEVDQNFFDANQADMVPVSAGTSIQLFGRRSQNSGVGSINVTMIGYLENTP